MRTIEGYLEKGRFYPIVRSAEIKGRRRVLVTVLNDNTSQMLEKSNANNEKARKAWLKYLNEAIASAQDEEFPEIPRSKEMRLPVNLSDIGGA